MVTRQHAVVVDMHVNGLRVRLTREIGQWVAILGEHGVVRVADTDRARLLERVCALLSHDQQSARVA